MHHANNPIKISDIYSAPECEIIKTHNSKNGLYAYAIHLLGKIQVMTHHFTMPIRYKIFLIDDRP